MDKPQMRELLWEFKYICTCVRLEGTAGTVVGLVPIHNRINQSTTN